MALDASEKRILPKSRGFPADAASQAWVTLATNDAYATGALVLGNSLLRAGTTRKKVVMVSAGIKKELLDDLRQVYQSLSKSRASNSYSMHFMILLSRCCHNGT